MIKKIKEGSLVKIQLDRPELHNAFNPQMIEDLKLAFQEASNDSGCKMLLLSGSGKSFCAGADLNWMKEMKNYSKEENQKDALKLFSLFETISQCEVPVLAKAHGSVFGGGIGLLACCDFVAMEKNTKLCFSEVKWGLSPATISPFVLRKMQKHKAYEYMLSASLFSATDAASAGLVHFVGSESEVNHYVEEKLKAFQENGPEAVRATKKLFAANRDLPWEDLKKFTAEQIADRRTSLEGQEGLGYFVDKKIPSWKENS